MQYLDMSTPELSKDREEGTERGPPVFEAPRDKVVL